MSWPAAAAVITRGEVKHHKNVDLEPGTLSTLVMSSWSVLDNLEI